MAYSNSKLVAYKKLSPNHSGKRTHSIDRITPHCVVGQCSVETLGSIFSKASKQASSNYGIGPDGRVGLYVEEKNRSWCSSSPDNDQRAVTIECASDTKSPYKMNDKVYASLIKLCTDICERNGKDKLIWLGSKDKTLKYKPKKGEMVITVHRWFANKSCPGKWLYDRLPDLAEKVTANLADDSLPYRVRVSITNLNIRKGPGTDYEKTGKVTGKGTFTITAVSDGKGASKWGQLKSGDGWISLDYAKKI